MTQRYAKTVIYRIPVGDKNYYGHTTLQLHRRKKCHKEAYKLHPDRKVYKAMRDIGMTENDIELIWVEDWSCENVDQARARERYWIERDGTLNKNVPNRSNIEYKREKRADDEFRSKENERNRIYMREKRANDDEYRSKENERNREYKREKYASDAEFRAKTLERNREYSRKKVAELCVCDFCGKQMTRGSLTRHKNNFCKYNINEATQ